MRSLSHESAPRPHSAEVAVPIDRKSERTPCIEGDSGLRYTALPFTRRRALRSRIRPAARRMASPRRRRPNRRKSSRRTGARLYRITYIGPWLPQSPIRLPPCIGSSLRPEHSRKRHASAHTSISNDIDIIDHHHHHTSSSYVKKRQRRWRGGGGGTCGCRVHRV